MMNRRSSWIVKALGYVLLTSAVGAFLGVEFGCGNRSVGSKDTDGGMGDSGVVRDGSFDAGLFDAQVSDGWTLVTGVVGWYSQAFEHIGFVSLEDVDPSTLEGCNPYISAVEGGEMWWLTRGEMPEVLSMYPTADGYETIGLVRISGAISPLGQYGHMGGYQREVAISSWELLTCETVAALGHCVVPGTGHLCVFPEVNYETRRSELWRVLPGPASDFEYYELSIIDNENVLDGTTVFSARFCFPYLEGDPETEWELFDINILTACNIVDLDEERDWMEHQLIPYNEDLQGWVMRNRSTDTLKISLSGSTPEEGTLHLWVDKEVDGEIGYP